ncbi:SufD family Fe-S cluster assembly protein [Patescibacteria group bacterium]|nr:SufD family Fe-S cluster assembly protein [Patescibacteria group bacterium]
MKKQKYTIRRDEEKQIVIDGSGEYLVELVGPGARAEILGALVARGDDVVNVEITIVHKAPDTTANTLVRAVARDRAKVVLSGMIRILKRAQKTNTFLAENILLLSDAARADAIPNLEIEADDVRASHAATVGKIDEEQIFYLMSRGLSRAVAEEMIVDGFLDAVRARIRP